MKEEWIGDGIPVAVRLINDLKVNEQILHSHVAGLEPCVSRSWTDRK